jgi:hypothetical protein
MMGGCTLHASQTRPSSRELWSATPVSASLIETSRIETLGSSGRTHHQILRSLAFPVWTPATTDTRQIDIPSIPSPCLTPPRQTSPPARSAAAPSRMLSPANTPSTCTRGYVQFDEVHGWLRSATTHTHAVRAVQHRTED